MQPRFELTPAALRYLRRHANTARGRRAQRKKPTTNRRAAKL